MSKRILRVDSLIKRELSRLILKEMDFFPNILVTLTRVETADDLLESNAFISVLPFTQAEKIVAILNKSAYFLQQKLNQRLKMRPLPRIKFLVEKKIQEAGAVEEVLEKIRAR